MTELITGISPQPNFPHEDLTDTNADLLELMIANHDIRVSSHAAVEQLSWMFRIGHPTILFSAGHIYDEDERLAAINHGVVSFEAITAMVGGNAAVSDMIPTNREASRLLHLETTGLSNYFDEAVDELQAKTPRTAGAEHGCGAAGSSAPALLVSTVRSPPTHCSVRRCLVSSR